MGVKANVSCEFCRYFITRAHTSDHGKCFFYPPVVKLGTSGTESRPYTHKDMFCSKWVSKEAHWAIDFGGTLDGG